MSTSNSIVDRLVDRCSPPAETFDSGFERQCADLFVKTALSIIVWGPVVALLYLILSGSTIGFAVSFTGTLLTAAALPALRWTERIEVAANIFVGAAFFIITGLAVIHGGFETPLVWVAICPMLAVLFSGERSGWAWLGLCVIVYSLLFAATFVPSVTFPSVLTESELHIYRYIELIVHVSAIFVTFQLNDHVQNWLLENLRGQKNRTQTVLETAPDGILGVRSDGTIERSNPAARAIFDESHLESTDIDDILPDVELEHLRSASAGDGGFETMARSPDGDSFPVHVEVGQTEDDTASEMILAVRDITEQKRREQQLREARDEAMEANRAKSAFLANMSHELRTPLNAVIGYSEMLIENAEAAGEHEDLDDVFETEQLVSDLERVSAAGDQLLALIDDVLDLSKIEAGELEARYESVDIQELFADLRATLEPSAEENGNELNIDVEPGVGTVRTDPQKLRQILTNLGNNACKFTEDGFVELTADRTNSGEGVLFTVRDNGIGMSDEEIDDVLEAFQQSDPSSTREYGGTGLGLAICQNFTELLDGDLRIESEPGEGTTVEVELPDESEE